MTQNISLLYYYSYRHSLVQPIILVNMKIDICEIHHNSSRVPWLTYSQSQPSIWMTLEMSQVPWKHSYTQPTTMPECYYFKNKVASVISYSWHYYSLYQRGIGCTEHWCLDVSMKKKNIRNQWSLGKGYWQRSTIYVEGCESSSFPGIIANTIHQYCLF